MRAVVYLPLTCWFVAALAVAGCSSDPAPLEDPGIGTDDGGQTLDSSMVDGNTQSADYPPGPFGQQVGNVIKDYVFDGLMNPTAVNYVCDDTTVKKIALHDFYNPTKDPAKSRVMILTWGALWCPWCKTQAGEAMKVYNVWHSKGAEMMELVFEDAQGAPAVFSNLKTWTQSYKLGFPSVLDPEVNSGIYFDKNAAPYNMVIDLSTMKITFAVAGYMDSGAIEGEFVSVLGQ
jgi:hypothetical protein